MLAKLAAIVSTPCCPCCPSNVTIAAHAGRRSPLSSKPLPVIARSCFHQTATQKSPTAIPKTIGYYPISPPCPSSCHHRCHRHCPSSAILQAAAAPLFFPTPMLAAEPLSTISSLLPPSSTTDYHGHHLPKPARPSHLLAPEATWLSAATTSFPHGRHPSTTGCHPNLHESHASWHPHLLCHSFLLSEDPSLLLLAKWPLPTVIPTMICHDCQPSYPPPSSLPSPPLVSSSSSLILHPSQHPHRTAQALELLLSSLLPITHCH